MIVNGDAGRIPLGDGLVHCVVTSPPYWSLRKYAGEQERDWPAVCYAPMPGLGELTVEPMRCALGLEATVEAFIGHLVMTFREVKRVLRDDGVCWVVIGDSYASSGKSGYVGEWSKLGPKGMEGELWVNPKLANHPMGRSPTPDGVQQGDLLMVPHRLALALQGDGWIVRNDCPWNKVNPMPESVRGWTWQRCRVKVAPSRANRYGLQEQGALTSGDLHHGENQAQWSDCPGCAKCEDTDGYVLRRGSWRHTRAHETILQLVKGMQYFSDQEKVREGFTDARMGNPGKYQWHYSANSGRVDSSIDKLAKEGWNADGSITGRNPRSVLTVSSEPYSGAHYACFPRALIAPLIRATCPAKCCPVCGTGWSPVVEKESATAARIGGPKTNENSPRGDGTGPGGYYDAQSTVLGYRPSCECLEYDTESYGGPNDVGEMPQQPRPYAPVPGIVLDPFLGSGTTGNVAKELGLRWIGLDLAHEYLDQQAKIRTGTGAPSDALDGLPMFVSVEVSVEVSGG